MFDAIMLLFWLIGFFQFLATIPCSGLLVLACGLSILVALCCLGNYIMDFWGFLFLISIILVVSCSGPMDIS